VYPMRYEKRRNANCYPYNHYKCVSHEIFLPVMRFVAQRRGLRPFPAEFAAGMLLAVAALNPTPDEPPHTPQSSTPSASFP
jgi:hypothetical protein